MFRKLLKLSHDLSVSLEEKLSARRASESWLCTMPTEILIIIFSYLPPKSLVAIRELGIKRLTEISLSLKVADFSQCNTVLAEDMSSFFTKDRVEHIREISFDNVFFISHVNLEKYIIKCKHLTVLSVIDCGLSYANIIRILKNCSKLEELYWTLFVIRPVPKCEDIFENIKKLYLHIQEPRKWEFFIINTLLTMCPEAHDVCLNISPYFSRTLPHEIARSVQTGKIFFKYREHPVNVVTSNKLCSLFLNDIEYLMDKLHLYNQPNGETIFITGDCLSFYMSFYSSYLQFITEETDMAKLSSLPDNSVHSLIVLMNDNKAQLLNHMEKIKRVSGLKLDHLTFHNASFPVVSIKDHRELESSDGTLVRDILSQIVSTSVNISVLNLSEVHFDIPFHFPALYCLKRLRVFSISACCLKRPGFGYGKEIYENQIKGFEGFVQNCGKVEKFSFLRCLKCKFGPDDHALAAVSKWKKLKSFTIREIDTFRVCPFLIHIAHNCPDFQSLELNEVGDPNVCHFIPNVMYIIKNSKKLLFLRINQPMFYPANCFFWKAIESAKNLQGICIRSKSKACVENKIITDAIRKLPFLHVFHLAAPRICQNLVTQIKQIFAKNGIQSYDIHVFPVNESYKNCDSIHFPTF
ncbi:uncharacterized protein LOC129988338 [Argiope bruennichi]|uniref:uncharacterized protein LOC129988338 n=1 Tax=Argiope bruennichi TaxID=94029 RepID=UPI0024950CFC|nr:uncharacterized protein LOC129988338 [Argiope bruennichi]